MHVKSATRADWLRHPMLAPVAFGLSIALILLGIALGTLRPAASPAANTTALNASVVVAVSGAVLRPGVYTLAANVRIIGLINAAGGTLPNADITRINLAEVLFDGMDVFVPLLNQPFPTSGGGVRVNINTADAATLETQLGLSKKTANAIITYRQQHGKFQSTDQLLLVPISKTLYNRIKNQVTV